PFVIVGGGSATTEPILLHPGEILQKPFRFKISKHEAAFDMPPSLILDPINKPLRSRAETRYWVEASMTWYRKGGLPADKKVGVEVWVPWCLPRTLTRMVMFGRDGGVGVGGNLDDAVSIARSQSMVKNPSVVGKQVGRSMEFLSGGTIGAGAGVEYSSGKGDDAMLKSKSQPILVSGGDSGENEVVEAQAKGNTTMTITTTRPPPTSSQLERPLSSASMSSLQLPVSTSTSGLDTIIEASISSSQDPDKTPKPPRSTKPKSGTLPTRKEPFRDSHEDGFLKTTATSSTAVNGPTGSIRSKSPSPSIKSNTRSRSRSPISSIYGDAVSNPPGSIAGGGNAAAGGQLSDEKRELNKIYPPMGLWFQNEEVNVALDRDVFTGGEKLTLTVRVRKFPGVGAAAAKIEISEPVGDDGSGAVDVRQGSASGSDGQLKEEGNWRTRDAAVSAEEVALGGNNATAESVVKSSTGLDDLLSVKAGTATVTPGDVGVGVSAGGVKFDGNDGDEELRDSLPKVDESGVLINVVGTDNYQRLMDTVTSTRGGDGIVDIGPELDQQAQQQQQQQQQQNDGVSLADQFRLVTEKIASIPEATVDGWDITVSFWLNETRIARAPRDPEHVEAVDILHPVGLDSLVGKAMGRITTERTDWAKIARRVGDHDESRDGGLRYPPLEGVAPPPGRGATTLEGLLSPRGGAEIDEGGDGGGGHNGGGGIGLMEVHGHVDSTLTHVRDGMVHTEIDMAAVEAETWRPREFSKSSSKSASSITRPLALLGMGAAIGGLGLGDGDVGTRIAGVDDTPVAPVDSLGSGSSGLNSNTKLVVAEEREAAVMEAVGTYTRGLVSWTVRLPLNASSSALSAGGSEGGEFFSGGTGVPGPGVNVGDGWREFQFVVEVPPTLGAADVPLLDQLDKMDDFGSDGSFYESVGEGDEGGDDGDGGETASVLDKSAVSDAHIFGGLAPYVESVGGGSRNVAGVGSSGPKKRNLGSIRSLGSLSSVESGGGNEATGGGALGGASSALELRSNDTAKAMSETSTPRRGLFSKLTGRRASANELPKNMANTTGGSAPSITSSSNQSLARAQATGPANLKGDKSRAMKSRSSVKQTFLGTAAVSTGASIEAVHPSCSHSAVAVNHAVGLKVEWSPVVRMRPVVMSSPANLPVSDDTDTSSSAGKLQRSNSVAKIFQGIGKLSRRTSWASFKSGGSGSGAGSAPALASNSIGWSRSGSGTALAGSGTLAASGSANGSGSLAEVGKGTKSDKSPSKLARRLTAFGILGKRVTQSPAGSEESLRREAENRRIQAMLGDMKVESEFSGPVTVSSLNHDECRDMAEKRGTAGALGVSPFGDWRSPAVSPDAYSWRSGDIDGQRLRKFSGGSGSIAGSMDRVSVVT
ncbi:hypothetical protein HDU76_004052, partial [Blyttiomyces sp. JEL0837]